MAALPARSATAPWRKVCGAAMRLPTPTWAWLPRPAPPPPSSLIARSAGLTGDTATHEMTLVAKQIVRAYYERDATRAYFVGCSTGGEQACGVSALPG